MDKQALRELLDQYLTDSLSAEGKAELLRLMEDPEASQVLESYIESDFTSERYVETENLAVKGALHTWLKEKISGTHTARPDRQTFRRVLGGISIAASIALVLGTTAYFLFQVKSSQPPAAVITDVAHDAQPASYKAKLTLPNGQTVVLDSLSRNQTSSSGLVTMSADGTLLYDPGKNGSSTIATNKGETFSFRLPDGSQVWLNSASSITIPAAYMDKERRTTVSGEVYVKVAADPSKPFVSVMNGATVTALGTEFNLNAYPDEPRPTATLVNGRVRVTGNNAAPLSIVLAPGQQAQILENGQPVQRPAADLDRITAWKDGLFHFDNADMETVLREFSRWYDIEVVYEGKPSSTRKFFGIVRRSSTLVQVLEILKDNEIKFTVNGKQLIVSTK